MSVCEIVMGIEDLRREIFSYLRKKAKVECIICKRVCVWDKKVCNYITYKPNIQIQYGIFAGLVFGDYCIRCWGTHGPFGTYGCTIN